jgi:hypothetical protein
MIAQMDSDLIPSPTSADSTTVATESDRGKHCDGDLPTSARSMRMIAQMDSDLIPSPTSADSTTVATESDRAKHCDGDLPTSPNILSHFLSHSIPLHPGPSPRFTTDFGQWLVLLTFFKCSKALRSCMYSCWLLRSSATSFLALVSSNTASSRSLRAWWISSAAVWASEEEWPE